jgi:hypothetical protein
VDEEGSRHVEEGRACEGEEVPEVYEHEVEDADVREDHGRREKQMRK